MLGRTSHELADDRLDCGFIEPAIDRPRSVLRSDWCVNWTHWTFGTIMFALPQVGGQPGVQLQLREGYRFDLAIWPGHALFT